jgi:hypothetical protein
MPFLVLFWAMYCSCTNNLKIQKMVKKEPALRPVVGADNSESWAKQQQRPKK